MSLKPVVAPFRAAGAERSGIRVEARDGTNLSYSYRTDWNEIDVAALYDIPPFLKDAFLFSEDRNFFQHSGVDWHARGAALLQNIRARETVRGASTMTEQVVRMMNPRPRNLWSKWLEGIEAAWLERHVSKADLFEFYLNQIPYAAHRRGVAGAARYYFNRDLSTLNRKEMLALVAMARAPSAYDLSQYPERVERVIERLSHGMASSGLLSEDEQAVLMASQMQTSRSSLPVEARHFARFARMQASVDGTVRSTLDAGLQAQVQTLIDRRIAALSSRNVHNAAVLVMDHGSMEILSWVVGGAADTKTKGGDIDAVLSPRQPGSALKPFLYAMALEDGWTAATFLNDAPISEAVGSGLHRFRNYSNTHYGQVTLREALGNSLNIPAVLAINKVGTDSFLTRLHQIGFDSLTRGSEIYDEGLALGNGEVTLYELTRAYAALARQGVFEDMRVQLENTAPRRRVQAFDADVASLIGNILSDPQARALEFGRGSVLNLPVRTAIKTGTSTDYRDAWTIGYNDRYTVGIWMGNLDRTPMKDVTGSTGPSMVLRSVFQILNRGRETQDLYLSPSLIAKDVCTRPESADGACPMRSELFIAGTENQEATPPSASMAQRRPELIRPTDGLMIAYDPRIPAAHQKFRFEMAHLPEDANLEWIVNGKTVAVTEERTFLWPVTRGNHRLSVVLQRAGMTPSPLADVSFTVR